MYLWEAYRLVMVKEYITEWWVGQRRNQERNEAILVIKKKTQQNVGYIKSSPEREIDKPPIFKKKKKKRAQIDDFMMQLKNLENQELTKSKCSRW